jgi:hypothetical protein
MSGICDQYTVTLKQVVLSSPDRSFAASASKSKKGIDKNPSPYNPMSFE